MSDSSDDEQHVEAFRQLLKRRRVFREGLASRNDLDAAAEDALVQLGELRDLMLASELDVLGKTVFAAEGQDERPGSERAKNNARDLAATSRVLMAIGPAFLPASNSATVSGDLALMSLGDPSLLAAGIPCEGRAERPSLLDFGKAQATRLAYFEAGRRDASWKTEFRRLRAASDSTLKAWASSLAPAERETYRRVGRLVGEGKPLTPADEGIRLQATRYPERTVRDGLAALLD
jgi:hypothetical protein